jgi:hypothetical protein
MFPIHRGQFLYSTQGGADAAPHTPGWVWAGPSSHIGENEKCQGRRPATEKKPGRGRAGGRCSGGATKPPMPRLAVVEAAELACELRV